MDLLPSGKEVDASLIYFRTTPRFDTSASEFEWLTKNVFVGTGKRLAVSVEISSFQIP
jgi:hypothetical protein